MTLVHIAKTDKVM